MIYVTIGNDENTYNLHPNPSSGLINITQSIIDDIPTEVKVTNYLGHTVYKGEIAFSKVNHKYS